MGLLAPWAATPADSAGPGCSVSRVPSPTRPHVRLCSTWGGGHARAPSVLTRHRVSCDAQTGEQPLATDQALRSHSWPVPVLPTGLWPRCARETTRVPPENPGLSRAGSPPTQERPSQTGCCSLKAQGQKWGTSRHRRGQTLLGGSASGLPKGPGIQPVRTTNERPSGRAGVSHLSRLPVKQPQTPGGQEPHCPLSSARPADWLAEVKATRNSPPHRPAWGQPQLTHLCERKRVFSHPRGLLHVSGGTAPNPESQHAASLRSPSLPKRAGRWQ